VNETVAYGGGTLAPGIRSRFIANNNGLTTHLLEAGWEDDGRPCILLLHGFPELAYSWRKIMGPLAAAGYHVVAPDQRGYGRTTGWDGTYDGDLGSFGLLNLVRDAMGLVAALGHRTVVAVVGHDFGSPVAAYAALIRPDIFRSVVLMSAPFAGPPPLPAAAPVLGPGASLHDPASAPRIHDELAALERPRKHYHAYYATREADEAMRHCRQGVHTFLRAYYHMKSADWKQNRPHPLGSWSADELAKLPTYYVMELDQSMPETVALEVPGDAEIAACHWLPEAELRVYSAEYTRNGFQGGLQWYRCAASDTLAAQLELFAGRSIDVPSCFIAGQSDWGVYQRPGAYERMQRTACTQMVGCDLVDGAGHWVQQEQPMAVTSLLLEFLERQIQGS
jgi:pimeloyl-ACP methyl ester carboxylesterase